MSRPNRNIIHKKKVETAYRSVKLRKQNASAAKEIEKDFKVSPVAARILAARGYKSDDELKTFISPTLKEGLPAPAKLKNLEAAADLIAATIKAKQPIAICCDFDVDGLSGGAQVYHYLKRAGAECQVFVPDRFADGYGLNERTIRKVALAKFGLVITIDFGTTNLKELAIARELGLKTIVIDHHHVANHDIPADIFVNPCQPGCGFAGKVLSAAGLAWYLLVALRNKIQEVQFEPRSYLDLACLGTICDMVPLIGANRVIAKRGLEILSRSERAGLIALKSVIGVRENLTCTDVSFGIGPRLNAAGRMVHGEMVIELLTTDDAIRAKQIATQLNKLNQERQDTESQVKERAVEMVKSREFLPPGIVVWEENFHTGVIGIVAQRLVEIFYRPAAVLGVDTEGIYKGSVRGIKGLSVVETLAAVKEHLIKFGGHEGAGGFSVEEKNLPNFQRAFEDECAKRLEGINLEPYAEADTEVTLEEVTLDLVDELKSFSPCGMGNPNPQLLVRNLKVVELKQIKGTHLKTMLTDGSRYIAGMLWRQPTHPALVTGAKVNVVFKPDRSTFNGVTELQATINAVE